MTLVKRVSERPYFSAGLLGVLSLPVHFFLPLEWSQNVAATILAMIGGIYLGFAVQDGRGRVIAVEGSIATVFAFFAAIALATAPALLPAGYIAHGLWDAAHHRHRISTDLPRWYIPFCALYDIITGLGLWLIWSL